MEASGEDDTAAMSGSESSDGDVPEGRWLPLNSRRLTTGQLQLVAETLGLPTSLSTDELRQVIDGKLEDMKHDPRHVQVVVRETAMREVCLLLVDETGVFQKCGPLLQSVRVEEREEQELQTLRQQVKEAAQHAAELEALLAKQQKKLEDGEKTLAFEKERAAAAEESLAYERERAAAAEQQLVAEIEGADRAVATDRGELPIKLRTMQDEVEHWKGALQVEKDKARQVWRRNCQQLTELEGLLTDKEAEVATLKQELERLQTSTSNVSRDMIRPTDEPNLQHPGVSGGPTTTAGGRGGAALERRLQLPAQVSLGRADTPPLEPTTTTDPVSEGEAGRYEVRDVQQSRRRRGKAPPVDPFTGEDQDSQLDDWLPALERACQWNDWTEEELLLQLAGHLRGRALQEWSLIDVDDRKTWEDAIQALRSRLEPGSRAMAAQDFRHLSQGEAETVADYIRRLERTFRLAYGRDKMSTETRETLLHSQLQEGLRYDLMKAPSVSGAQTYRELCMSAKNEEKRLSELRKRQQYMKTSGSEKQQAATRSRQGQSNNRETSSKQRRCYLCGVGGHLAKDCRKAKAERSSMRCYTCGAGDHFARDCKLPKSESGGRSGGLKGGNTRQVQVDNQPPQSQTQQRSNSRENPEDFLLSFLFSSESESEAESESEEETSDVRQIRDQGSQPRCAKVEVQGVPMYGILDTGADITIMGSELFKKVAAVAKLRKRDFKKPDRLPRGYDGQPFTLDGRMDLDITFKGKTLHTPIYIKMDAQDQLLLSEGVCRQLNILTYDADVQVWRGGRRRRSRRKSLHQGKAAKVPSVRVRLVRTTRLPPRQSAVVPVQLGKGYTYKKPLLLEPDSYWGKTAGLEVPTVMVEPDKHGRAPALITNPTGYTQRIHQGARVGRVSGVDVITPAETKHEQEEGQLVKDTEGVPPETQTQDSVEVPSQEHAEAQSQEPPEDLPKQPAVSGGDQHRRQRLRELLPMEQSLSMEDKERVYTGLLDRHNAFALEEGERGETDLTEMEIDTGDASPVKQHARRLPFAVRQEVARQLKQMQAAGVIKHSNSPWASPIVLVRKKDGSLRFCIDYRKLNAVTKADVFPLPRIDDLLDQLGKSKYFSTLDLAAGYWQIPISPSSQEKTAFVTHQGLYQFQVMPFGLKNAPAAFQRLMQQVLMGLNPEEGPDYVAVYLDDVLVFSPSLEKHLHHLQLVMEQLMKAGLKLKPSKCYFVRREVKYLGHIITPEGLKPNPEQIVAVRDFPVPQSIKGVRQFLGLASYYRRFIPSFAKIAHPLHALTCKGAVFEWTGTCQAAFETLRKKLVEAPVLAYPDFDKDFHLETDASIKGLGAVLSQEQSDGRCHPIAYASRALSPQEKNYGITDLETLAVVWAISHFHAYLYGHKVTVHTDHSAVKAVLETPSASGKHARWWTKVYSRGVREVNIVYRAGKENASADCLSRNPYLPAPTEGIAETEVQVAVIQSSEDGTEATTSLSKLNIEEFLKLDPISDTPVPDDLGAQQQMDPEIAEIFRFLQQGELPMDERRARKIAAQSPLFTIVDNILYYLDPKRGDRKRAVVPKQLRQRILEEHHSGPMAGHFAGNKVYNSISRHWWWEGLYADVYQHCRSCPQCTIVSGSGRQLKPPLHPIPVQRAFQIVGLDIMDLPKTESGNQYVVVFQDYLTKWPMVYPVPDQKSIRIVRLLTEEVIPTFGVPEALLSDRGTNLLSFLMRDVCNQLGIKKLNTTAYHPQCDGMVERFNRTLKTILRKHAEKFGRQWDRYLPGILWAYRNTPHDSTGEKPSFLLFGFDCRSPSEAALLPTTQLLPTDVQDYREELVLSLSSARSLAARSIQTAQKKYKMQYDQNTTPGDYRVGDWVMVYFPQDEAGALRKLSRPWHGPYRVVSVNDPDVSLTKVYFPQDGRIQVHQTRVQPCPLDFPGGFYWYGSKRRGPGRPPKWTENLKPTSSGVADHPTSSMTQQASSPPMVGKPRPDQGTKRGCQYPLRNRLQRSGRAHREPAVM